MVEDITCGRCGRTLKPMRLMDAKDWLNYQMSERAVAVFQEELRETIPSFIDSMWFCDDCFYWLLGCWKHGRAILWDSITRTVEEGAASQE